MGSETPEDSTRQFRLVGSSLAREAVSVPAALRERWEAAYRLYSHTVDAETQQGYGTDFAGLARAKASASWEVARAWREITQHAVNLPWWVVAALEAAAEAYEDQARDYNARAEGARRPAGSPEHPRRPSPPKGGVWR